jgi:hypothetical protein
LASDAPLGPFNCPSSVRSVVPEAVEPSTAAEPAEPADGTVAAEGADTTG